MGTIFIQATTGWTGGWFMGNSTAIQHEGLGVDFSTHVKNAQRGHMFNSWSPIAVVAEIGGLLELADCQIGCRLNERPCVPELWWR